MKVLTVVGARPQFIKASVLSAELANAGVDECLVHSGQHYDYNMSKIFFDGLNMKTADYCLDVGSSSHAVQTAKIMEKLEPILFEEAPNWVLVYGDTNTTLAGAIVASKLGVPLGHVEAGLRSFNRTMPEEINRVVTDHVSDALFVPSETAAVQLRHEGITHGVHVVGDLMIDLVLRTAASLSGTPEIVERFNLRKGAFGVATIHRVGNTENSERFRCILKGLQLLDFPIVFPVHPRTLPLLQDLDLAQNTNVIVCEPLSYVEMVGLQKNARVILTDSGGLQKEAVALEVPCVTFREETEWIETLDGGWNVLVGADALLIKQFGSRARPLVQPHPIFGSGDAAGKIRQILEKLLLAKKNDFARA